MQSIGAKMTKTYIKELNIKSFGKFKDKRITFSPDFNLLYGLKECFMVLMKEILG